MRRSTVRRAADRRGNILILTAFMMVFMMALLAVAVDIGYLQMARTQLQKTADAAALAAAAELIDNEAISGHPDMSDEATSARAFAIQYAALNKVCSASPTVDSNPNNDAVGDIVLGYLADPSDRNATMDFSSTNRYNAVQVRVRRTVNQNGEVPFFFARVLGIQTAPVQATATAALMNTVGGFRTPPDGSNLNILPYALDKNSWDALMAGTGNDAWSWDEVSGAVHGGADGIKEVNLFPQGTGAPGNRGTVDIGSSNNSTSDIARQIVDGISPSDLAHLGGQIKFDAQDQLYLNGDTGISAGVKDELASIRGQPRVIPLFSQVVGPGNNAQYTIVAFAGIRVMEVVLTGSQNSKRILVQPAPVVASGMIPGTSGQGSFVYSPVWLVR